MRAFALLAVFCLAASLAAPIALAHPDYNGHCVPDEPCDLVPCDRRCFFDQTRACAEDLVRCWHLA